MGGHPLALLVAFDATGREPGIQLLAVELVGDGVVVPIDLNVVVDIDADLLPLGELVGCRGQWLQDWCWFSEWIGRNPQND